MERLKKDAKRLSGIYLVFKFSQKGGSQGATTECAVA